MKVAILGAGDAGSHIGNAMSKLGHEVTYGVRNIKTAKVQAGAKATDMKSAVKNADIVVVAVLGSKAKEAVSPLAQELKGKIIIDLTNVVTKEDDWAFSYFAAPDPGDGKISNAEEIAKAAPGAKVVKAFNVVFAPLMEKGNVNGEKLALFIAGDDKVAKDKVAELGKAIGFEPFDVGPLKLARHLEAMGLVMIKISADDNWANVGFRVLKERSPNVYS